MSDAELSQAGFVSKRKRKNTFSCKANVVIYILLQSENVFRSGKCSSFILFLFDNHQL